MSSDAFSLGLIFVDRVPCQRIEQPMENLDLNWYTQEGMLIKSEQES